MGFETRAGQRSPAARATTAGTSQPTPAAPAEHEQPPRLDRGEALRRLDTTWGPLPPDTLDWARERLGVNGGLSAR